MKIIDLYNKVANGEELPKYIKWRTCKFKKCYIGEEYYCHETGVWFFRSLDSSVLNEEIEVLDEYNKIEKLDFRTLNTQKEKNKAIKDTVNKIIDKLNEIEEGI